MFKCFIIIIIIHFLHHDWLISSGPGWAPVVFWSMWRRRRTLMSDKMWLLDGKLLKSKDAGDQVIVTQLQYTCLGESFFSCLWGGGCGIRWNSAQHSSSLRWRRGSISVNVIWHGTQRQLRGADDSVKPCLWRLHAWCCWAVIWSSHAKADRQAALSQAGRQSGSQGFHRDDNTSVSVKSVQECLNLKTFARVGL